MRVHTKTIAVTLMLTAAGWFAGCNQHIDEEPNVVLEIDTMQVPPISGTRDATTGVCILTITNATVSFKNKPKNSLAGTSPFNDIILQDLLVNYVWDDGNGVASSQFGIGGTVPANGSSSALFPLIKGQDLILPVSREGHTASLSLLFRGTTVAGESVSATTGGTLVVNPCQ